MPRFLFELSVFLLLLASCNLNNTDKEDTIKSTSNRDKSQLDSIVYVLKPYFLRTRCTDNSLIHFHYEYFDYNKNRLNEYDLVNLDSCRQFIVHYQKSRPTQSNLGRTELILLATYKKMNNLWKVTEYDKSGNVLDTSVLYKANSMIYDTVTVENPETGEIFLEVSAYYLTNRIGQ